MDAPIVRQASVAKDAGSGLSLTTMKIQLSQPERQIEMKGPKRVKDLLRDLNLLSEAHLVIRGDELVTEDETLQDADVVEVRPVISGG